MSFRSRNTKHAILDDGRMVSLSFGFLVIPLIIAVNGGLENSSAILLPRPVHSSLWIHGDIIDRTVPLPLEKVPHGSLGHCESESDESGERPRSPGPNGSVAGNALTVQVIECFDGQPLPSWRLNLSVIRPSDRTSVQSIDHLQASGFAWYHEISHTRAILVPSSNPEIRSDARDHSGVH
jgi:hypothetical protein